MSAHAKILIVDDIDDNLYTLERRLNRDGYSDIVKASGGNEALGLVESNKFDLVLLDLMMPDVSGLEVLKKLKSDPEHRKIPVIMVTAADEVETTAECIAAGAEDYLTKPINSKLVKARVAACLKKKKFSDYEEVYLKKIEADKKRTFSFLKNVLPAKVADELNATGSLQPRRYQDVLVLVCDLVGFTSFCEKNSPEIVFKELQMIFEKFEVEIKENGLEKIKTVGDAIVATAGLESELENPVLAACKCALGLKKIAKENEFNWGLHVGIHSGPIVAGLVGKDSFQFDILGQTVNTAFNICDLTESNEIYLSSETWIQAREHLSVESKGLITLKSKIDIEVFNLLTLH